MAKHILPIVKSQLPEFIRSEHPQFQLFINAYYEYLEKQTDSESTSALNLFKSAPNAGKIINNAEEYRDVHSTLNEFVEYFQKQLTPFVITGNKVTDGIVLQKARDVYLSKGSPNSFKLLFRMLFGQEIDIFEPKEQILIASESLYTSFSQLKAEVVQNESNLGDFNYELSTIRLDSDTVDSDASANILTVLDGTFTGVTKNNRTVLTLYLTKNPDSDFNGLLVPRREVKLRDAQDKTKEVKVRLLNHLGNVSITDGGSGFRVGDKFFVKDSTTSIPVQVTKVQSGEIDRVMIRNRGKNYRVGDTIEFLDTASGSGALAFITAVDAEGAVTQIDGSNVRLGEANTGYLSEDFEPVIVPIIQKGQYTHIPVPFIRTENGAGLIVSGLSSEVGRILEVSTPQTGFFDSDSFGVPTLESPLGIRIANEENIEIGNVIEFQHFTPDSEAGSLRHDSEIITIDLRIFDSDGITNDSDTLYWAGMEELGSNILYSSDKSPTSTYAPGSMADSDGGVTKGGLFIDSTFDKHRFDGRLNGLMSTQYVRGEKTGDQGFGIGIGPEVTQNHFVNYSSNRKYFFRSGLKFKPIRMPIAWDSENYRWKIRTIKYYDSDGDSDFIERWKSDSEFDIQGITPTYYSWELGQPGPNKWARWVSAWAAVDGQQLQQRDSDGRFITTTYSSSSNTFTNAITTSTRVAGKPGQRYGYPINRLDSDVYDLGVFSDGYNTTYSWYDLPLTQYKTAGMHPSDPRRTTKNVDSDGGGPNGVNFWYNVNNQPFGSTREIKFQTQPASRHAVQAFPITIDDPRLYRLDKFHIDQLKQSAVNDSENTLTYSSEVFVSADEADSDGTGKGVTKSIGQFVSTGYGGVVATKSDDGTSFTISKADSEQVLSTLNQPMNFPTDSEIEVYDRLPNALLRVVKVNPADGTQLSPETFPVSNTVVQYESPTLKTGFPLTSETEKTFLNESGFISSISGGILRDNYTVSEFSYIIQTELAMNNWRGPVKETVHPAGLYMFGELNVDTTAQVDTGNQALPHTDIGNELAVLTFDADDDYYNDAQTQGAAVFADSVSFAANPFNVVSLTNDASGTFLTADYTQKNVESSIQSQRGNAFFDYEPVGLVHKVWTIFDSEGHYNYVRGAIDSDSDLKVKFGMYFTPRQGDGKLVLGSGFDSDFFKREMTTQRFDSEIKRSSRVANTKLHYTPSEFHSAKRYNNVETIGLSQVKYEDFEQFRVYDSEIPSDIFQRFDSQTAAVFEKIDYSRIKDSENDVDTFVQAVDRTRETRIRKAEDFNTALKLEKELVFTANGTTYFDLEAFDQKYNQFNALRDSEYNEGWSIPGKYIALGNIRYLAPDSEYDSDRIVRDEQVRSKFGIEKQRGFSDTKSPRTSRAFGDYLGGENTIIVRPTYPVGAGINNTAQLLGTISDSDYKENLEFKRKN